MLEPIVIQSPNKKYKVVLKHAGEIQPGNSYYSLSIGGFMHTFENRVFGPVCMWSPDSRFLVVQEWNEIDDSSGYKPLQLLIIDLVARRECVVASVDGAKSNILPEGFIAESLMYKVIYDGQFGITKNFESKFKYLDGWQTIK